MPTLLVLAFLGGVATIGCNDVDCVTGATEVDGRCVFTRDGGDAGHPFDAGPMIDVGPVDAPPGDASPPDAPADAGCSATCDPGFICAGPECIDAVVAIAGGLEHTCAIRASGTAACWGGNTQGELGDRTRTSSLVPVAVMGLDTIVEMSLGEDVTCARLASGEVQCWGDSALLGDGSTMPRLMPGPVSGLGDAMSIAVGESHACAVRRSGDVACWGAGASGALGDGMMVDRPQPVPVVGIANASKVVVGGTRGETFTCALLDDGTVQCWGNNTVGQLGDGRTMASATPVRVVGVDDATDIAAGMFHVCVRRMSGSVACWGRNFDGELGTVLPSMSRPNAADASDITDAVSVTARSAFTCALRPMGAIACWGANENGQLGDGTMASHRTPAPVNALPAPATAVAAGLSYACAPLVDGRVACWGYNMDGQLGDGTTDMRALPVLVTGLP